MSKKKVIMLSYSFPPIKGIGTIRNYNMAQQFNRKYDIKVFSTRNRFVLPLENNIEFDTFDVKYLRTIDYKTIKSKLDKKNKMPSKSSGQTSNKTPLLNKLMNSFPFNLFIGEGGLFYVLHGFFSIMFMSNKKDLILYSSYRPMADHYIAYLVKLFIPKVYWIADFRDEPINLDREIFVFPKFQKALIKKIIKKSDLITTVSKGLSHFFKKIHSDVFVLRNGMSTSLGYEKSADFKEDNSTFKFVYTGMLYKGRRDPDLLMSSLKNLISQQKIEKSKIELVYAGKEGDLWKEMAKNYGLNDCIRDEGFVSLTRSFELQNTSQVNLLLSWATKKQKGILTGKFYEYLKAKRPIILLIKGEKDSEFEKIMDDLKCGIVGYNELDKNELELFILDNYNEWKETGDTISSMDEIKLKSYTWDEQFNNFYKKKLIEV